MPKKASERRKSELGEVTLNLNPMMDMFAVLIPALLMMSVVVEVATVNAAVPSIGPSNPDDTPPPDEVPLNFTVTITQNGYILAAQGAALNNPQGQPGTPEAPTIPIIQKKVTCSKYRGTVPPPRLKNSDAQKCNPARPTDQYTFWIYDTVALHRAAVSLKEEHPNEYRVTISAEATVDFEPVADVMDTTRDTVDERGEVHTLFHEVVMSPPP